MTLYLQQALLSEYDQEMLQTKFNTRRPYGARGVPLLVTTTKQEAEASTMSNLKNQTEIAWWHLECMAKATMRKVPASALLSAEGNLYARQKLRPTEAGTFRMVAEFVDSQMAPQAACQMQWQANRGKTEACIWFVTYWLCPRMDIAQPKGRAAMVTTPWQRDVVVLMSEGKSASVTVH